MNDQDWLAERFEANRSHLRGIAYRMLGSLTEADDAVQESWIRLSRTDTSDVGNLRRRPSVKGPVPLAPHSALRRIPARLASHRSPLRAAFASGAC